MSEEIKNINVEETENEVTEVQEVKESKIKEIGAKVWGGVKKYGKPVVAVAAIAGSALLAYKLGKNSNDCGCDADCAADDYYADSEAEEITDDVTTE